MEYIFEERADFTGTHGDPQDSLDAWFAVSGDTDDFIFFGENDHCPSNK